MISFLLGAAVVSFVSTPTAASLNASALPKATGSLGTPAGPLASVVSAGATSTVRPSGSRSAMGSPIAVTVAAPPAATPVGPVLGSVPLAVAGGVPSVALFETYDFEIEALVDFDASATGGASSSQPNPWLHVRLDVYFDHLGLAEPIRVPGYFAGDGNGRGIGRTWRAHFTPHLEGDWTVAAFLETRSGLNASEPSVTGTGLPTESYEAIFEVTSFDPEAPGFRSKGFVESRASSSYLHHSGPGQGAYIQCGIGSPENFLGYAGFSGTTDGGSANGQVCCCKQDCFGDCGRTTCSNAGDPAANFLHRYEPHVQDWRPGDPDWTANGSFNQGRGIIGALNFISSTGVNSMYMLLMNLGGDGKDTHPFLTNGGGMDCPIEGGNFDPSHTLNYHVQRMDQWRATFEHANAKGIMLQLFLAEQEACNIRWFGPHDSNGGPRNHMSVYRRLFQKQMVAQFSHLLALRWNLCEENRSSQTCTSSSSCGTPATSKTPQFTAEELDQMGRWIRAWDPYDHPIGVHTTPGDLTVYSELLALPNTPEWLTATSLQIHGEGGEGSAYERDVKDAAMLFDSAGLSVPIFNDEQGSPSSGLAPEGATGVPGFSSEQDRRRRVLYDVLLSGGQVAYYFGYYATSNGGGDLRTEDFRTRTSAMRQLGFAARLMEGLGIERFTDGDNLLSGSLPGSPYGTPEVAVDLEERSALVIYYSGFSGSGIGGVAMSSGQIDLSDFAGVRLRPVWVDPVTEKRIETGLLVDGGGLWQVELPTAVSQQASGYGPDSDLLLVLVAE